MDKQESTELKHLNDLKAFIKYLNDMDDIYKNIEEFNLNKKRKKLIIFCDTLLICSAIEKHNPIKNELFIRGIYCL